MATKAINRKSQTIAARVPHDIAGAIEELKEPGESTGQFVVAALEGEIKRRLRTQSKRSVKGDTE
ncbi:YlcI/YnfO family protein [Klebsiella pneumoniae]|uniref:YlcI/YnfO family protein n=1 Tax=Klebsiella pneumoniae TaxID=573 RepID=UPI000941F660|nr:YlcI/YnfO family protein [Klebsiella pneumoniae]